MNQRMIDDITSFIFMNDAPQRSDVILIPGTSRYQITERAAELYHQGLAPYILPSGKWSPQRGRFASENVTEPRYQGEYETEFDYCRHILLMNGVPDAAILREDRATHTMENARFSAQVLREKGVEVHRAILCCQAFHARRAFMSYGCCLGDAELLVLPVDTQGISARDWYLNEASCRKVMQEVTKCGAYFAEALIGASVRTT